MQKASRLLKKSKQPVWHRHLAGENTGFKPVPHILQQAARAKFRRSMRPFAVLVLQLGYGTAVASQVEIHVVRVNDTVVPAGAHVAVLPGDTIECDTFISSWGVDFPLLSTYQLQLESAGMVSGVSGALRPGFYSGPIPLFNRCNSDDDCIDKASCDVFLCRPPTCAELGGCPDPLVCSRSGWCFQDIDAPLNGSREAGVFIEIGREEFAYFELFPIALVDITIAPGYRWGAISLTVDGIPDEGVPKYAGSFLIRASVEGSQDGEACGTFTLGFVEHIDVTFFCTPPVGGGIPCFAVPPTVNPLVLEVDCYGEAALLDCNRDGAVTLLEHRHLIDCLEGTAFEGTCFCLDADGNETINLHDFAEFQNRFDGE